MARRDRRPLFASKLEGRTLPKRPKLPEGKAPGEKLTPLERVRAAVAAEDWREATRLSLKLPSLGPDEEAISRAQEAFLRPDFLRQVNKDPEAAIEAGKAALRRRFGS